MLPRHVWPLLVLDVVVHRWRSTSVLGLSSAWLTRKCVFSWAKEGFLFSLFLTGYIAMSGEASSPLRCFPLIFVEISALSSMMSRSNISIPSMMVHSKGSMSQSIFSAVYKRCRGLRIKPWRTHMATKVGPSAFSTSKFQQQKINCLIGKHDSLF